MAKCQSTIRVINRFFNHVLKVFLKPIPVFVFHQVSDLFDETTMWKCDWTEMTFFKQNIVNLQKKYTFISLSDAYEHICYDRIRLKNYAVLTCDDGWKSVENIIPWLMERHIPLTLFVNPKYLDGCHFQERKSEQLLTYDDLMRLSKKFDLLTIASHGWDHSRVDNISFDVFKENFFQSESILSKFYNRIPFYAFTYGIYTNETIYFVIHNQLVPVDVSGRVNQNDPFVVHRICIDGMIR